MNLIGPIPAYRRVLRGSSSSLCLFIVAFCSISSHVRAADSDFDQHVAPILMQNCLPCHNSAKARAGLNLSSRESILKGSDGGEVLVPGKPHESLLVQRATDGSMPPETDGRRLTKEEADVLAAWVQGGAKWPDGRTLNPAATSAAAGLISSPGGSSWSSKRSLVGRVLQHFRPRRNLTAAE
jgi:Planctomycete cytochrome C